MKVIFDENFLEEYARMDPAAQKGRLDSARLELSKCYDFVKPDMAEESDILLVHSKAHLEMISESPFLLQMALLAAGGAITASELAMQGEPAFGLIRPPGHHATVDDCWGFCWFNNIAVAVEKLRQAGRIKSAFILDIDLHFGDGTMEIFSQVPEIKYLSLGNLENLSAQLAAIEVCDIIGISAGFDRHIQDWGGIMQTEDYREIGRQVKILADRLCPGKIFAVLEGGYNSKVLGPSIIALLKGLERKVNKY